MAEIKITLLSCNRAARSSLRGAIRAIIHSYFLTPTRIKGLEVVKQHLEAGVLDFHISGLLANRKRTSLCIECNTLIAPTYYTAGKSNFLHKRSKERANLESIAIWFKGLDFSEPNKFASPNALVLHVGYIAQDESLENIRISRLIFPMQELRSSVE